MKTFISSAIFFLQVRWPFGNYPIIRHLWLECVADFVLLFGFVFCFIRDIQDSDRQEKED